MRVQFTFDMPPFFDNRVVHPEIEDALRHVADLSAATEGFAKATFPLELMIKLDDGDVRVLIEPMPT